METDFIAVRPEMDLADMVKVIARSRRNIFPVVDEELEGKEARVFSDMMPSGRIICDGRIFEATMTYGYALKGESVRVVRAEQGRLYCEKIA